MMQELSGRLTVGSVKQGIFFYYYNSEANRKKQQNTIAQCPLVKEITVPVSIRLAGLVADIFPFPFLPYLKANLHQQLHQNPDIH